MSSERLKYEQELANEPFGRHLFQVLRRLESLYPEFPRFGRAVRARQDPVRLRQQPSLAFAPSAIESVRPGGGERPTELSIYSFGLFGPNGPLPHHLTEYARAQMRQGDPSFKEFADIFHHRMICLLYRAWATARPTTHFDRPAEDRFALYVGSLAGLALGTSKKASEEVLPPEIRLYYAGQLASPAHSPDGLLSMISEYIEVPVAIEEFVGHWVELPPQSRCRLGESRETGELGRSVVIGSKAWQCQDRFRLVIGPLAERDYLRLLPPSETVDRLVELVRSYAGDEFSWEVRLILKKEDVRPLQLGRGYAQLGLSSWLHGRPFERDPRDYVMEPQARSG